MTFLASYPASTSPEVCRPPIQRQGASKQTPKSSMWSSYKRKRATKQGHAYHFIFPCTLCHQCVCVIFRELPPEKSHQKLACHKKASSWRAATKGHYVIWHIPTQLQYRNPSIQEPTNNWCYWSNSPHREEIGAPRLSFNSTPLASASFTTSKARDQCEAFSKAPLLTWGFRQNYPRDHALKSVGKFWNLTCLNKVIHDSMMKKNSNTEAAFPIKIDIGLSASLVYNLLYNLV